MAKIVAIRHGNSFGNQLRIIQGINEDYGLTDEGKVEAESIFYKNEDVLSEASIMLCSPRKRAFETAQIVNKHLGLEMVIEDQLREVDPGILAGMYKSDVEKNYPELFEIWEDRRDLDKIPQAERGEELQARIISFLMQYKNQEDACMILVTHAAFIRALLNTIDGKERTNKFLLPNGEVFIREDIFSKLDIEEKSRAMSSEVYIVNTANGKYVVKIKNRELNKEDFAEKELLTDIKFREDTLAKVLSMENYKNGKSCKVLKFVEGTHKYGKLCEEDKIALLLAEKELSAELSNQPLRAFKKKDIYEELEKILNVSENEYVREFARRLLKTGKELKIENKKMVLGHSDLNRDNILFFKNKDGNTEVNLIDWESLEYAPEGYQLAGLLASSFLLEGENMKEILEILKSSGKNVEEVLYLMHVRVLRGLFFFSQNKDKNSEISSNLLKKYFLANEKIEIMRDLINDKSGVKRNEKIIYR